LLATGLGNRKQQSGVSELAIVLDDGYVPLGGAANRLSREFLNCTAGEVMDLLKTAVFNGEFDDGPRTLARAAMRG